MYIGDVLIHESSVWLSLPATSSFLFQLFFHPQLLLSTYNNPNPLALKVTYCTVDQDFFFQDKQILKQKIWLVDFSGSFLTIRKDSERVHFCSSLGWHLLIAWISELVLILFLMCMHLTSFSGSLSNER